MRPCHKQSMAAVDTQYPTEFRFAVWAIQLHTDLALSLCKEAQCRIQIL